MLRAVSEEGMSSDADSDACEELDRRPPPQDPCYRCRKRVYPVERIDVGVLFHRRCFRCRVCGLQLSLRTFHFDQENDPDVYCKNHVPKFVGTIDGEALGVRTALNAPKVTKNKEYRSNAYNSGWQFETNHTDNPHPKGKNSRTSLGTYQDYERSGIFALQSALESQQKVEEDELYDTIRREKEHKLTSIERELELEKERSVREMVDAFEQLKKHRDDGTLELEKRKLEAHYRRRKEERVRLLMERLSADAKESVARLIEKHSQEMLDMISQRLSVGEPLDESIEMDEDVDVDVTDRKSKERPQPPDVCPPEVKRAQMFKSPCEFKQIDDHVFNVAKREHQSFTDLVKSLTVNCETDLEKARTIFRWITVKDLNKLVIDETVSPDSPFGLLRGIQMGTESYHDLFKRLCSYAGLYCEVIQGYSKGAGYRPGMRIEGNKFRNSWTAVNIAGSWCFINCNWGARHVKGPQYSDEDAAADDGHPQQFFYKCDEFYFVTDPEDHIYQHYPDEPKWQLLECPITLTEFITLPIVKSPFFNYGLRFSVHYDCIQYTQNGIVVLQLKLPKLLGFGYTFEAKDKSLSASRLEGRIMLRIAGHNAIFTIAPPKSGRYFFTVYAKDDWNSESLQSACAFRIKCVENRDVIKSPFPKVPFFGPTPCMQRCGMVPETHIDPLINCSHEDVVCSFKLEDPEVKLSSTFKYHGPWENDIPDFQRYVFVKHRDATSVTYQIRCPLQGKYVFTILGETGQCGEDGSISYDCLFRYLVECRQPGKDKRPLPRACHRWLQGTLLEPMTGDIPLDRNVAFRVRAPLANDVSLLIGDVWFHFKELHDSIWEGSVNTGTTPGKAKLYAKLDKERSRFSPLIEFQVK
ncbi:hillarin-like isoform X2 [Mya arenaria]|nr:hillarin-like isoform X2 [Mya arenaria]